MNKKKLYTAILAAAIFICLGMLANVIFNKTIIGGFIIILIMMGHVVQSISLLGRNWKGK